MDKTIINPSEIGKQLTVPQIKVIEDGKEVVRPDVIQAITQLASLGQLTKIRKSLEKEEFEGKMDTRTLSASEEMGVVELVNEWPYTPWATATFFSNLGSDPVYIGINSMHPFATLNAGESLLADYTKADRRMEIIYYWCDAGETASVRVVGKY